MPPPYVRPIDPVWRDRVLALAATATARPWVSTWEQGPPVPESAGENAMQLPQDLVWSQAGTVFGAEFYDGVHFGGTEPDTGLAVEAVNEIERVLGRLAWVEHELGEKIREVAALLQEIDTREDEHHRQFNEGVRNLSEAYIADARRQQELAEAEAARLRAEVAELRASLPTLAPPELGNVAIDFQGLRQMIARAQNTKAAVAQIVGPRSQPAIVPVPPIASPERIRNGPESFAAIGPTRIQASPPIDITHHDLGGAIWRLDEWVEAESQRQYAVRRMYDEASGDWQYVARLVECDQVIAEATGPTGNMALRALVKAGGL